MKTIKGIIREHVLLILILSFIFIIALLPKKQGLASDSKKGHRIENPHQVRDDKRLLKVGVEDVYEPLNPFFESSRDSSLYTKLIHKSLYKTRKDGMLEADIADHIWYENDGKDLHIVLKKDQKFQNGKTITSEDVINNILVLSDPSYDGTKSYYVESIGGYFQYKKRKAKDAIKVYSENDNYLIIQFSKASKDNLKILEMPIIPVESNKLHYGDLSAIKKEKYGFGAGNYHVIKQADKAIVLERNDGNKDIIDKIYIEGMPYYKARMLYQRGQIDIVYKYLSDDFYDKEFDEKEKEFTYFINNQYSEYIKLGFNLRDGFFAEDELRTALKSSIDFDSILELKDFEEINNPIYKNTRYYKDIDEEAEGLSLKELTLDRQDKEVSLAIYNGLEDVISKESEIEKAFAMQGLKLKISHINESEYYKIMAGDNKYDMFIILDQLITTPTLENQGIYKLDGEISDNALEDYDNINLLEWIPSVLGYENYEYAIEDWQEWYQNRLPYITLKSKNQITAINRRIKGLYINEFIGIEDETNLKLLNNLLK